MRAGFPCLFSGTDRSGRMVRNSRHPLFRNGTEPFLPVSGQETLTPPRPPVRPEASGWFANKFQERADFWGNPLFFHAGMSRLGYETEKLRKIMPRPCRRLSSLSPRPFRSLQKRQGEQVLPVHGQMVQTLSRACSRSARISSICSMPMESRTSSGGSPAAS